MGKKEAKLYIFVNDIIFFIQNILRNSVKKKKPIRNTKWVSRKVTECQINTQKSIICLYIFNEQSKNKVKRSLFKYHQNE